MVIFREVEVYPNSGSEYAAWVREDVDDDAFARRSRGICEAYSQALPSLALPTKASLLRLLCVTSHLPPDFNRPRPSLDAPIGNALHVQPDFVASMETGTVWVPAGFAELPLEKQQEWTLSVIHAAAQQLSRLRGGNPDLLENARRHVEEQSMRFVRTGPWKASPDRRHKARCAVTINDEGMGRVRLEVATRSGEIVGHCDGTAPTTDGAILIRLTRTVQWRGSTAFTFHATMDPYGPRQGYVQVPIRRDG